MKLMNFLRELTSRGGTHSDVVLKVPKWRGAWQDGLHLHKLGMRNVVVRITPEGEDYTLNTTHEVFSLDVYDVNLLLNGVAQKRSLVRPSVGHAVLYLGDPVVASRNSE